MNARRPRVLSNKRRKGVLAVALPWLRQFGLIVAGAILIAWGAAWIWVSGALERTYDSARAAWFDSTTASGFVIGDVQMEGLVHEDAALVRAALAAQTGAALLHFDVAQAQQRLEALPWIAQAHVERRLPATVYVRLSEREPLARWQDGGAVMLIDTQGEVIVRLTGVQDFDDLPLMTGAKAAGQAPLLMTLLGSFPPLAGRLARAEWIEGRRWDLAFREGPVVHLPEKDIPQALDRLARAQTQGGILEQPYQSIDLRAPGRMVLKPMAQGPGV